jgi:hypothetical protein
LINNLSKVESRPIDVIENRPIEQLVRSHQLKKRISGNELQEFAKKKYLINGQGITFPNLIKEFGCSKKQAQRRLKNGCKEKIDKDGKKSSILFTLDNERTIPQQYFPSCIRATIIENKRNRPIDPTGVNYNNKTSQYPLDNAVEQQIIQSFLTQLYLLPFQPLNMHNIHMRTVIDKSHYEEIKLKPYSNDNKTKLQRELSGSRQVIYKFNKNGSIEIEIGCSKNPFPIETSYDIFNFFVFLGQVKYTLAIILNDPRERIVPPVDKWILKYCDFNKDIELDDKSIGQLMGLNIQIKYAGEAFRLYVKNLEDRFALRGEKVVKVNQPITSFMNDSILNPLHLIDSKLNEHSNNIVARIVTEMNHKIDKLEKVVNGDK